MQEGREYRKGPTIRTETRLGPVELRPTSARHVYMDSNHHSGSDRHEPDGLRQTLRGVAYGAAFHAYRQDDGTWSGRPNDTDEQGSPEFFDRFRSLHASKLDGPGYGRASEPSDAARRDLAAAFLETVTAWAETPEGVGMLLEAEFCERWNKLRDAERKRHEAAQALRVADREMRDASDALDIAQGIRDAVHVRAGS